MTTEETNRLKVAIMQGIDGILTLVERVDDCTCLRQVESNVRAARMRLRLEIASG